MRFGLRLDLNGSFAHYKNNLSYRILNEELP